MSDLEKKLRICARSDNPLTPAPDLLAQAADRLRQYREALEKIAAGRAGIKAARTALKETTDVD